MHFLFFYLLSSYALSFSCPPCPYRLAGCYAGTVARGWSPGADVILGCSGCCVHWHETAVLRACCLHALCCRSVYTRILMYIPTYCTYLYIPIFTSRNNWKISILGHEMLNFSKLDLLLVRHFFKILLWVPEKWKRALTCNSFRDGSQICRVCATCYNYECSQSTNEKWVLMKSLEYDIFMDVCVVALCLVAQLYKPVHLDIQPKLKLNKYSFATEAGHWNDWLIIMMIFVGAALPSSGCSSYYFMCNLAVRSLGHERHWCPRCSKCLWGHLAGESQNASLLHDAFKGGYSIFDYLTQHSKSHIL